MPTYLYRPYVEKKYIEQGSKQLNIMSTTVNTDKFANRSGIRNLSLKSDPQIGLQIYGSLPSRSLPDTSTSSLLLCCSLSYKWQNRKLKYVVFSAFYSTTILYVSCVCKFIVSFSCMLAHIIITVTVLH